MNFANGPHISLGTLSPNTFLKIRDYVSHLYVETGKIGTAQ